MPKVLTTSPISQVTCGHGGTVQIQSTAKLQVNGCSALLESSIDGMGITGCTTPLVTGGTSNSAPCTTVGFPPPPNITAGQATKLMVDNQPVILDTVTGKTNGMVSNVQPQLLLSGTANHSKLTSV